MSNIDIDGKKFRVLENMGFNHDTGMYAKIVKVPFGERVAVKRSGGLWRFWTAEDRTRPLREERMDCYQFGNIPTEEPI